mmetsp:Transcript_31525/g.97395  ORF Transcript_31525/g.97395 Transcript_31525/m.97395 type:complete len:421 (-) Transcript_31525:288-1550(-)
MRNGVVVEVDRRDRRVRAQDGTEALDDLVVGAVVAEDEDLDAVVLLDHVQQRHEPARADVVGRKVDGRHGVLRLGEHALDAGVGLDAHRRAPAEVQDAVEGLDAVDAALPRALGAEVLERLDGAREVGVDVGLHPWVREALLRRQALARVEHDHLLDEVLRLGADRPPHLVLWEVVLPGDDALELVILRLGAERRVAAEQNVHDDAERPHVGGDAVRRAGLVQAGVEHLRGDVQRSAAALGEFVVVAALLGEAEVDDLDRRVLVLARHQEVLRLQVAVHDAAFVQVRDTAQDVVHHARGAALTEMALGADAGEEFATGDELQDDVDVLPFVEEGLELQAVLVVELFQDGDLTEELALLLRRRPRLVDDFHGELRARRLVPAKEHLRVVPRPELVAHLEFLRELRHVFCDKAVVGFGGFER